MAIITHSFTVDQIVWIISACGIIKATVKRVWAKQENVSAVLVEKIWYDVWPDGAGVTQEATYDEVDMFFDKVTALAEYDTRLGA